MSTVWTVKMLRVWRQLVRRRGLYRVCAVRIRETLCDPSRNILFGTNCKVRRRRVVPEEPYTIQRASSEDWSVIANAQADQRIYWAFMSAVSISYTCNEPTFIIAFSNYANLIILTTQTKIRLWGNANCACLDQTAHAQSVLSVRRSPRKHGLCLF